MALFRLTILKVKRDEQARVQVDELLNRQSITGRVAELEAEGLFHESNWYLGRLRDMKFRAENTFWDRQFACEPLDLDAKMFAAYRRAINSGTHTAYFCAY